MVHFVGDYPRFQVEVFIGADSKLHAPRRVEPLRFSDVLFDRPDRCRYAVVRNLGYRQGPFYEVWDLYHERAIYHTLSSATEKKHPRNSRPFEVVVGIGKNLDALIMKTLARYDHD